MSLFAPDILLFLFLLQQQQQHPTGHLMNEYCFVYPQFPAGCHPQGAERV